MKIEENKANTVDGVRNSIEKDVKKILKDSTI